MANGLTGDVARSAARLLEAGFLYRDFVNLVLNGTLVQLSMRCSLVVKPGVEFLLFFAV